MKLLIIKILVTTLPASLNRITLESKRFIDAARDALDSTMGTVESELRTRELKKEEKKKKS